MPTQARAVSTNSSLGGGGGGEGFTPFFFYLGVSGSSSFSLFSGSVDRVPQRLSGSHRRPQGRARQEPLHFDGLAGACDAGVLRMTNRVVGGAVTQRAPEWLHECVIGNLQVKYAW